MMALAIGGVGCEAGRHDTHAAGAMAALDTVGLRARPAPAEFQRGEARFAARCTPCHGEAALGSSRGPPLVHPYYEPNHHADAAIRLAVLRGVRMHHWGFGDMPPVRGISDAEINEIIAYIRWLQREAGV